MRGCRPSHHHRTPDRPAIRSSAGPPLEVPAEPSEAPKPHFSVASTGGPLAIAVVMVMISGNPSFALFSLLSPLVAIASYAESRRRSSRTGARGRRDYEVALREFERRIGAARAVERARRRERCPDPAEVVRRASLPSTRLWERRPDHDDFLHLFAGVGDVEWEPPLDCPAARLPAPLAATLGASRLRAMPVSVELADGGVVAIVGERGRARRGAQRRL